MQHQGNYRMDPVEFCFGDHSFNFQVSSNVLKKKKSPVQFQGCNILSYFLRILPLCPQKKKKELSLIGFGTTLQDISFSQIGHS